jgi:peptidoglycan/xylan/chitin deacetylase (PgdA/CDA1 family)
MARTPRRALAQLDPSLACRLTCPPVRAAARLTGAWSTPVLTSVRTKKPLLALTFDDGPDPHTTPQLLEALANHGAAATFFLIGQRAAAHPDLVRAIVDAGHELGNHLWDDNPSVRLSPDRFRRHLANTARELAPFASSPWFRPGSGWFTPRMLREAERQGYRAVLGSPWLVATTYGADASRRGKTLADRGHAGAIAVLHEGTPARTLVADVANAMLCRLAERGLHAVTVGALAGTG